jgi:hypothetical protein
MLPPWRAARLKSGARLAFYLGPRIPHCAIKMLALHLLMHIRATWELWHSRVAHQRGLSGAVIAIAIITCAKEKFRIGINDG